MKPFTPRELEVVRLLGSGLSVKACAERMGIRVAAVRSHVKLAASKIEDPERGPALRKVICHGFWMLKVEREQSTREAA